MEQAIAESTAIFTRDDLSAAQKRFGRIAEEFMRTEVLPRADRIDAKDWALTRQVLLKAGELDLLRIDIPEAYGGLFFFSSRRRHTRSLRDWSSDVCSSD